MQNDSIMPLASAHLDTLNTEQRRAVEHGVSDGNCALGGPLLVIAGAGSGKTNTLAHRVAHLIVNGADRKVPIIDTKASLTIHGDNEFNWIIGFRTEWDDCATGLQVTPP
jgi:superfamily I DNA and RNA helicase